MIRKTKQSLTPLLLSRLFSFPSDDHSGETDEKLSEGEREKKVAKRLTQSKLGKKIFNKDQNKPKKEEDVEQVQFRKSPIPKRRGS